MIPIQKVVKNQEWQSLRKSLLGKWKTQPEQNLSSLLNYLEEECYSPIRVRRVLNYLTGSGFRSGKITSSEISNLLKKLRKLPRV